MRLMKYDVLASKSLHYEDIAPYLYTIITAPRFPPLSAANPRVIFLTMHFLNENDDFEREVLYDKLDSKSNNLSTFNDFQKKLKVYELYSKIDKLLFIHL